MLQPGGDFHHQRLDPETPQSGRDFHRWWSEPEMPRLGGDFHRWIADSWSWTRCGRTEISLSGSLVDLEQLHVVVMLEGG